MGCGQSKINLYPRKNKNGGKGNSAKKTGAADKDADEDESSTGATGTGAMADEADDDPERGKHLLPLTSHSTVIEISASQQDFFKMLDEKIDEGRDYDSSSDTEVRKETERKKILIDHWRSTSQSSRSSSQPSPPTPARKRIPRAMPIPPERQNSPSSSRRCYRQQHIPDGMSPPPRRAHSAQAHHPSDPKQINGDWNDATKSPVNRPQSAGASWKNNPKITQFNQKPKKNEVNEHQKACQRDTDSVGSNQDLYNPQFQSPSHGIKTQPYIAQIVTYPTSQHVSDPPSPTHKLIAPPEEYQDLQNKAMENKPFCHGPRAPTPITQMNTQQHVYYIHGNATGTNVPQDLAQQRQQTAMHLQQYVAMKQAQQQMFTYLQRTPHTVYPNVDYTQHPRIYEGEDLNQQYGHVGMRPHSAPPPVGVVKPMPVVPGFNALPDGTHMMQMPIWSHMPPVVSTMGPWIPGQMPPEMQYYPQTQFMPMYRANSAGSAGTLTRVKKEPSDGESKNMCQSMNLVRQKAVGQIVSIPGQELTVCSSQSDSPSPASVSTDSGVSPGNSLPSSKNSISNTPTSISSDNVTYTNDSKVKKNKSNAPLHTRSLKNTKSVDS